MSNVLAYAVLDGRPRADGAVPGLTSLLSLNASSHAGNTTVHPRMNSVPLWGRLAKASKVPTVVPSVIRQLCPQQRRRRRSCKR